jgi:NAD(P)-dependent dehydrogenase (short-subunit alcohol dehydrogenase family)
MFQLHDKVALVTGAAQGMGKADAIALASQGAKVILTDRKIDLCKKVAEEINLAKFGCELEIGLETAKFFTFHNLNRILNMRIHETQWCLTIIVKLKSKEPYRVLNV